MTMLTIQDPIALKADILTPREATRCGEILGYTPDKVSLLFTIAYYVSNILHSTLLQFAPEEEIYYELLPAFCGVPVSGNNWEVIKRRLFSVILSKNQEDGEITLMVTLKPKNEEDLHIVGKVTNCPDFWTNEPEVAKGAKNDMLTLLPVEFECPHVEGIKSPACKPGHIHRSILHLGPDAQRKYDEFDQALIAAMEEEGHADQSVV